ncbi:MAG: endonuclease MutS2 [Oscillospiraceae bacterium]|jgi:DNA mismatch repair protein MutS2|nr:endonuclease MutS2 [Oscillospiraceae bacterium]
MINPKYAKTLELDKILRMLAELCHYDTAKEKALAIVPLTDVDDVCRELGRTDDLFQLTVRFGTPSFIGFHNPCGRLKIASQGGSLSPGDLLNIAAVLRQSRLLSQWSSQFLGEENAVSEQFDRLYQNNALEREISSAIVSEDMIDDNASAELAAIRRKIRQTELKARERMEKMIRSASYQKYLQDSIITMRDGRFVVPVKAEYKSEIPGLVHDTSGSGSTYFVEPIAVVEANNEIRVLQSREQEEIERILAELSAHCGDCCDDICWAFETIIDLNVLFAKTTLAARMRGMRPRVSDDGKIDLKKARHPLIDPKKAVPIDVRLGDEFSSLVITGPNTGGKTVTLKTVGLLTLMTMCGMLIPVGSESVISTFEDVLVDIGDEQSIEQSLSTFSAHMVNIISILDRADYRSLCLIDELGSGTDPVEGAALAISILERLQKKGCRVAATTHYAELKMYALQTPGVENACCEFDVESLRPTYRLLVGVPGRSNAFAISQKLGMEETVIERAKSLVQSENKRFEDVIDALESSRRQYEEMQAALAEEKRELEKRQEEIRAYQQELAAQREKAAEQAKMEAMQVVADVRREAEGVMAQLDEARKLQDSEEFAKRLSAVRSQLKSGLGRMHDAANPVIAQSSSSYKLPRPLKPGDDVLIVDIDKEGTVIKEPDKSGMVQVQTGIMKSRVRIENLRLLDRPKVQAGGKPVGKIRTADVARGLKPAGGRGGLPEIDLRGMNAEEALIEVDSFIDNAVLNGIHQVTLIHGKGTGVLREAVQQHLKRHKSVRTYRLGVFGEGETGVTIAELK